MNIIASLQSIRPALLLCALTLSFNVTASTTPANSGLKSATAENDHAQAEVIPPLPFFSNVGQAESMMRFYRVTQWGNVGVDALGDVHYSIATPVAEVAPLAFAERLQGARNIVPRGERGSNTTVNFIRGADAKDWLRNVPTFSEINLGDAYPGIEVRLRAGNDNVEKLFYVEPRADVSRIRVQLLGARPLNVDAQGQLKVQVGDRAIHFSRPMAYQVVDGKKQLVDVAYNVNNDTYGFRVGNYRHDLPLVIDPVLMTASVYWSTVSVVKVAHSGDIYAAGAVTNFQTSWTFYDATGKPVGNSNGTTTPALTSGTTNYIARFNANLDHLDAMTFFTNNGSVSALALDASDNVFVTGSASTTDLQLTAPAYALTAKGGADSFILKFSADLSTRLAGTFFGGTGSDSGNALAVDGAGNVYLGGYTRSPDLPVTPGVYDDTYGGGKKLRTIKPTNYYYWGDAFIAKFDNNLTTLQAATYFGGAANDEILRDLTLDAAGNVYIVGTTTSTDFPVTPGAYSTTLGATASPTVYGDGFVAKLNNALSSLLAATRIPGAFTDDAYAVAVDDQGSVFVGGITNSYDFRKTAHPVNSAAPTNTLDGQGYVVKFDAGLTSLQGMSFIGTAPNNDGVKSLALGVDGSVYAAGFYFTSGALVRFDNALTKIIANETEGPGELRSIAMDASGAVIAGGASRVIKIGAVDLGIAVGVNTDPGAVGSVLSYTLTATNYGVARASNIVIDVVIPESAKFISADSTRAMCTATAGAAGLGGRVRCTVDQVAMGGVVGIVVSMMPMTGGTYTATASVTATEPDLKTENNSATKTITVTANTDGPNLGITLAANPLSVLTGESVIYTMSVSNSGNSTAIGVVLTDPIPAGTDFVSVSSTTGVCAYDAGVVTCALDSIESGANSVVTLTVSPTAAGPLVNTVQVGSNSTDSNLLDNTASVTTQVLSAQTADLGLSMTIFEDPSTVGDTLTYTIIAVNNGPSDAVNVSIVDAVPSELTFVSATVNSVDCAVDYDTAVATCSAGTLVAGGTATVVITSTATVATNWLTNSPTVTSDTPDPYIGNNSTTIVSVVNP